MANTDDPKKELATDNKKIDNGDTREKQIDDGVQQAPATSFWSIFQKKNKAETEKEKRDKLFDGSSDVQKPKMRGTQEILTKYKFGGDAAAAAADAKNKLMERQEKLARIEQESAELENEAENFATLAQQITKKMENKRWWKRS